RPLSPTLLAIGSVLLVSIISLLGILLCLTRRDLLERSLLPIISFSTGALLGDVFIHLIPEIAEKADTFEQSLLIVLLGVIITFAMEKLIHWRHCHVLPSQEHYHPVGFINLIGDGIHNFIDGALIAASFLVSVPLGLATTMAVVLHEIPQEIGDFALLLFSGYSARKAAFLNFLSAGAALLGAAAVLSFSQTLPVIGSALLPFTAGNFLYIAGADLIPELHKETRIRQALVQLLCMIAGISVMYGLTYLE
ncbi:MAG: ZIP family metal transporter, partial [Patescibacteria group bacterium]